MENIRRTFRYLSLHPTGQACKTITFFSGWTMIEINPRLKSHECLTAKTM